MHKPEDDRRFATVARISEINLGMYRLFLQPWLKATITPEAARWIRRMHPIRLGYKLLSDRNPLSVPLPVMADFVRNNRHPVEQDNLFKALETMGSEQLVVSLNSMRDLRDSSTEKMFMEIYGQPLLQAAVGLYGDAHVHRRRPGAEPERRRFVEHRQEALREKIAQGGAHEAVMRSLIYVMGGAPATDERNFKRLRASRAELEPGIKLSDFKNLVREQFFILKLDRDQALNSLPTLLAGSSNDDIDGYISHLEHVSAASGELSEHAAERFVQVKALFDQARPAKKTVPAKSKASSSQAAVKPKAEAKPSAAKASTTAAPAAVKADTAAKPEVDREKVKGAADSAAAGSKKATSEVAASVSPTPEAKQPGSAETVKEEVATPKSTPLSSVKPAVMNKEKAAKSSATAKEEAESTAKANSASEGDNSPGKR